MPDFMPREVRPGDPILARLLNEILRRLKALEGIRVGSGLVARRGANGLQIASVVRPLNTWVGTASGAITARSGTTMGAGTVAVVNATSGTATSTGLTVSVLNAGTSISSGKYCSVAEDVYGVNWVGPMECE